MCYNSHGIVSNVKGPDGLNIETVTAFYPQGSGISKLVYTRKVETGENETKKYDLYGRIARAINTFKEASVFTYDDYGRLTKVEEDINGQSVTTKTFDYRTLNTSTGKVYMSISKSLNNPGTNEYVWVESFKDAIGREIQVKTQSVVDGVKCWVVSGKNEFDKDGRMVFGICCLILYRASTQKEIHGRPNAITMPMLTGGLRDNNMLTGVYMRLKGR